MNQRHRSYPRVTFRDRIAIPIARADRRWLSGLATTLLFIVGCGGSAPTTTAPSVATGSSDVAEATPRGDVAQVGVGEDEDGSTADLAEHHRHHHQGGFAMFIAMSLDLLNVSPDQTTAIVKIRNDMRVKMQPARDAEKVVLLTLANGIAAGKIDQPTVDAAIAQVTTAGGIHDTVADSLNELHATLTGVEPSAIRVSADPLTYPLHIVLRFQLELALIEGELAVSDLPGAWRQGMRSLLGVEVPSDALGCLQDVHWGAGSFGYFPSYALGCLIAAQLWEAMQDELGPREEDLRAGELAPIQRWLGERVHRYGRRLDTIPLIEHATGRGPEIAPFLRFVRPLAE